MLTLQLSIKMEFTAESFVDAVLAHNDKNRRRNCIQSK